MKISRNPYELIPVGDAVHYTPVANESITITIPDNADSIDLIRTTIFYWGVGYTAATIDVTSSMFTYASNLLHLDLYPGATIGLILSTNTGTLRYQFYRSENNA